MRTVTDVLVERGRTSWFKDASLRHLYLILIPSCLLTAATTGYDGSMLSGLQAVSTWKESFNNPQGSILGFMSGCYNLGAACSAPLGAFLANRYGRKVAIIVGSCITIIGAVLQAAAQNVAMFIVARMIIGFGVTVALISCPVMISELSHPCHRNTFTSLFNTNWYLGSLIAAWTTFGTFRMHSSWGWRLPSILQGVPAIIQLSFIWFLPESPRYLIANERGEEAIQILAKYHAAGNVDDELVQAEFAEMNAAIVMESQLNSGKSAFRELFRSPANRHRTFICFALGLFSQWSGNGLVSYFLVQIFNTIGIKGQTTQTLLNAIITVCSYIEAICAAVLAGRMKRRPQFMISIAGMLFCMIGFAIGTNVYSTHKYESAARAVLAMIFIFYAFYNLALNPLLFGYAVEILPFAIRAPGVSVVQFTAKSFGFFNQWVNPIALSKLSWKYYIVFSCILIVELAVVYFGFPETKGYSLEGVDEVFRKASHRDDKEDLEVGKHDVETFELQDDRNL
ncbi:general substrate transporter [Lipomyces doorenjongii]|uniref:general substrate transporter n=1 Tax=Lipomyces doorenjongii TaxID=383834 RepID=UPI0034CF1DCA